MADIHPTALVDPGRARRGRRDHRRLFDHRSRRGDRRRNGGGPARRRDRPHDSRHAQPHSSSSPRSATCRRTANTAASRRPRPSATTTSSANTSSIHAGTAQDRGDTAIGNGNLFLAYTHVAHDCVVGNFTTFSNNAQIAGHVRIDDWVVMGAYSGVHQFGRVGAHAMVGTFAAVLRRRAAVHDGLRTTRPSRTAPTTRACAGAASPATTSSRCGGPTRRCTGRT